MPLLRNYPVFLMSPPFGLSAASPNNAFMEEIPAGERRVDRERALRQWLEVYNFLASMSMVALLPQGEGLQDQSYVANLGVVLTHRPEMPIVVSNFTAEERRGEAPAGARFLALLEAGPVRQCPYRFEGEADCKLLRDNVYAVGVGMRTSTRAAAWFEDAYDMRVVPITMRNEKKYHLDCVLFSLDRETTLVSTADVAPQELRILERVTDVVDVPGDLLGATNVVRCNRLLLYGTGPNRDAPEKETQTIDFVARFAADHRMELCVFDISEFGKSGADLSCMILHMNRPVFAD